MVAGMFRGLSREDAARFAFLLATPVILAAGALKIPDLMGPLGNGIRGQVLVGSVLSGVGAYLSVRFLLRYFRTRTLNPFADLLPGCRPGQHRLPGADQVTGPPAVRIPGYHLLWRVIIYRLPAQSSRCRVRPGDRSDQDSRRAPVVLAVAGQDAEDARPEAGFTAQEEAKWAEFVADSGKYEAGLDLSWPRAR